MQTDRSKKVLHPWKLFKEIMNYLFLYYRVSVIVVLFLIAASAISGIAVSILLQVLIDDYLLPLVGANNYNFIPVIKLLSAMAVIYYTGLLCNYIYNRMMIRITRGTTRNIRVKLFAHMEKLPLKYFDTRTHGEIMSIFTNDTDTLRQLISQSLPQMIASSIVIISALSAMWVLNVQLFAVTFISTLVMAVLVRYLTLKNASYFTKQQENLGKLNGYVEELLAGQKTVKLFSQEERNIQTFKVFNKKLKQSAYKSEVYANILYPIMTDFSYLSYIITALLGGGMLYQGNTGMTLGILAAFLQLSRLFVQPISSISQQINYVVAAIASASRIFHLLDEEPEKDEGKIQLRKSKGGEWKWQVPKEKGNAEVYNFKGDVLFSEVGFSYNGKTNALTQISFSAKGGEVVAFVGATGAGKTTVINLLNRFYDISSGSIQIDGFDLQQIKKSELRKIIGVVTQDTWLFSGTIKENIAYGKENISDEEVIQAAQQAQAHNFIMALPEGYDTKLTNNGENLSEGQRQLLAIARMIAADPLIVLLDEATASLDTRTEKLLQYGIKNLMKGRTIFIIAHHLTTVRNADCILVLDKGNVIEKGTHEELMEHHGVYEKMCYEGLK